MPSEADCLVAHAFHQTAVARDDPSAVIDQRLAEARRQPTHRCGHDRGGDDVAGQHPGGFVRGGGESARDQIGEQQWPLVEQSPAQDFPLAGRVVGFRQGNAEMGFLEIGVRDLKAGIGNAR